MDKNTFADRINEALEITGVSAYSLSKKIDKGQSTISNYRSGKTIPDTSTIKHIASSIGVSFKWLNKGEGEMFSETVTEGHYQKREDEAERKPPDKKTYSESELLKMVIDDKDMIIEMQKKELVRLLQEIARLERLSNNDNLRQLQNHINENKDPTEQNAALDC